MLENRPYRLSIIITCYRYLQRLRIALQGWCNQDLPPEEYEVLVASCGNPDGLYEYLEAVAHSYPALNLRRIEVEYGAGPNKGRLINRAVAASGGEWLWLADADCLFPSDAARRLLTQVAGRENKLFYGERRLLPLLQTDELLVGRRDGLRDFQELLPMGESNAGPWGYTQIVRDDVLKKIPYRECYTHFAQSDLDFISDCHAQGIEPEAISGLTCLHLYHSFAWYTSTKFL